MALLILYLASTMRWVVTFKTTALCHREMKLLLLLLTAIGLSPGGSSPALVQTKIKIHITMKPLQNIKKHKTRK
jgi:hypothetical protein